VASRELVKVAAGADPVLERKEARRSGPDATVGDLLRRWLEEYSTPYRKTTKDDRWRIEGRLLPALGTKRLDEVAPADVKALHRAIRADAPTEANRVIETLRAAWNWAVEDAEMTNIRNPVPRQRRHGRKWKAPERERKRYVTPEEMPRLIAAIDNLPHPWARGALWLILLTGSRKSDVLRRTWPDVRAEDRTLRLRDATKADGETRILPLGEMAWSKLQDVPRVRGVNAIFVSTRGRPLRSIKRHWSKVRTAAKLEDVTIHDLRRTVGSWLANDGYGTAVIKDVLGHVRDDVTDRYTQLDLETIRGAVDRYAELVAQSIEDHPTT
jgi:integrase